jgi:UDP-glucose 4-epimerase
MTVLVTGGAGYIGSHMVHALLEAGDQVVVLDNLTTGFDWAVPPGATLIAGDAGDQSRVSTLIAAHRIDAIIHFAASIIMPDSVRDPLGYYRNNTVNSRVLVEAVVKAGVRYFIFSSTAAVYGNPTARAGARGRSHRADLALRVLEADERNHVARCWDGAWFAPRHFALLQRRRRRPARAHRAIDQGGHPSHRGGGRDGARAAAENGCLRRRLPDAGWQLHQGFIHVSDLVAAHSDAFAYLRDGAASATLNCGYGRGFSVLDVIDIVKRVAGVDFKVEVAPRRAGDPTEIVAACDRVRSTLGWQPHFEDLQTIVAHALAWERKLSKRAG